MKGGFKKSVDGGKFKEVRNISVFTIQFKNDINWFSHAICSSRQSRLFTPPFWLARYRSEMTTFFKRFPATKQNRPQWADFRIVCTVGYYLDWKKKFAGLGGVKGGLTSISYSYMKETKGQFKQGENVLLGEPFNKKVQGKKGLCKKLAGVLRLKKVQIKAEGKPLWNNQANKIIYINKRALHETILTWRWSVVCTGRSVRRVLRTLK